MTIDIEKKAQVAELACFDMCAWADYRKINHEVKQKKFATIAKSFSEGNCAYKLDQLQQMSQLGIGAIQNLLHEMNKDIELQKVRIEQIERTDVYSTHICEVAEKSNGELEREMGKLVERLGCLDVAIHAHLEHRLIENEVTEVLGCCLDSKLGDLTEDSFTQLAKRAEEVYNRDESLRKGPEHVHFSKVHHHEELILEQQFKLILEGLNLARTEVIRPVSERLELLIQNLEELVDNPGGELFLEVQNLFLYLPSEFRRQVFVKMGMEMIDRGQEIAQPKPKPVTSVKGHGTRRRRNSLSMKMEAAIQKEEPTPSVRREIHQLFSGDVVRLLEAVKTVVEEYRRSGGKSIEKKGTSDLEGSEPTTIIDDQKQTYAHAAFQSLGELKQHAKYVSAFNWGAEQMREVVQLLLDAAERGHADLSLVYYGVWVAARQQDPDAGCENYGAIHAADDVERLLNAIDWAMNYEKHGL